MQAQLLAFVRSLSEEAPALPVSVQAGVFHWILSKVVERKSWELNLARPSSREWSCRRAHTLNSSSTFKTTNDRAFYRPKAMKRQADDAGGGGGQGSSSAAAAAALDQSPSLFDPTHLPTLLPRILSLASLVAQASSSSDSLFMRTEAPGTAPNTGAAAGAPAQNEQQPHASASAPSRPDITLGASSEEDVDVALQLIREHQAAAGASGGSYTPTKLHGDLVREAKELDDAFRRAKESVDGLKGKDLDVAEQEDLIEILENYRQRQECVYSQCAVHHRR